MAVFHPRRRQKLLDQEAPRQRDPLNILGLQTGRDLLVDQDSLRAIQRYLESFTEGTVFADHGVMLEEG